MRIYFEQKTFELNVHIFLIKLFTQKVHVYLTGSIYTKRVYVLHTSFPAISVFTFTNVRGLLLHV